MKNLIVRVITTMMIAVSMMTILICAMAIGAWLVLMNYEF